MSDFAPTNIVNHQICRVRNIVEINTLHGTASFITLYGLEAGKEHFAIAFGPWKSQKSPLVRVHSECITGDLFGSKRCDCGEQLDEAINLFKKEGGILIYLRQEGRGIGLYNKLDAYVLQQAGMDTFEANSALGFAADDRSYYDAALILKAIGKTCVRMLTNNPKKVSSLAFHGIEITEQVPTQVFLNPENIAYLQAKKTKDNHSLDFTFSQEAKND